MFAKHNDQRAASRLDLGIEPLENRRLLAVEVTASGNTATISGDDSANTIILQGMGISGTDVNLDDSFLDNQFDITTYKFDLRGGNDILQVQSVFGFKNIEIDGGDGDNVVFIDGSFLKQVKIVNGNGDDSTQISNTQIGLDGNRNTGLIDIRNGDGGSDVLIESTGPGSGRSLHANKVTILNGRGGNTVDVRNIRARQTSFLIGQQTGLNSTTFENVDRIRDIKVIHNDTAGIVTLKQTTIESGGIFVQSFGEDTGVSVLKLEDNTSVARNVIHVGQDVVGHRTEIVNSEVGSVRLDTRGTTKQGAVVVARNSAVHGLFQLNHRPTSIVGGGEGTADVSVDNVTFDRAFNIRLRNSGSDIGIVDGTFQGSFNVAATTGSKGDTITIDDSEFLGAVKIKTGTGAGSTEDDEIAIEQNAHAGATRFHRTVTITTAGGNDSILLGGPNVLTRRATFDAALRVNGGFGADELSHDVGFFAMGPVRCSRIEVSSLDC
ncbi:MAG: hypothetical protein AAGF97_08440 [Planctomycetota bacterium]